MDPSVTDSGLRIVGKSHQEDHPYMEDYYTFTTADKEDYFMAVYDDHGGYEATQCTYNNLWEAIKVKMGFIINSLKLCLMLS